MFYVFAVGSMLGYALQNVLLAHHARKVDGLSLAFYRNASFVLTLLPLLFGASRADMLGVLAHWPLLVVAGASGGVYLAISYASYRYLAVGITGVLTNAAMTMLMTASGWIFLGERLSPATLALVALIVAGCLVVGISRRAQPHLSDRFGFGVFLVAISAIFLTVTKYAPILLSRAADPLVSGYFWEVSIGIASGVLILLRRTTLGRGLQKIDGRSFLAIALCSWPTLAGTGLYTLAMRNGPAAVVTSIGTASVVVASLVAWPLYRERLTPLQWTAIVAVLAAVVGLKFA